MQKICSPLLCFQLYPYSADPSKFPPPPIGWYSFVAYKQGYRLTFRRREEPGTGVDFCCFGGLQTHSTPRLIIDWYSSLRKSYSWQIPWGPLMQPYWGSPPKTQTSQYGTAPQLAGTGRTWERKRQVLHHRYERIREWRKSEVKTKKVQLKFEVVKMKNGIMPFTGG